MFQFSSRFKMDLVLATKGGPRPNHGMRHEPTVCQGCWCWGGGFGRWEVDDRRSDRVRAQHRSLLVSSQPASDWGL
jgi:hypothetical protein